MDKLYAVFLESLDMNLAVYESKDEAQKAYDEYEAAGKPVRMEIFEFWQAISVEKSNGTSASDPGFWEEIVFDNGSFKLVQTYSWHQENDEQVYYPDYILKFF